MKKTLSLLLALFLALGMTPVFAEETADADALSWGDVYPDIEALGIAGDYYIVDGMGVAFWIPASLHPMEPDETEEDPFALGTFGNEYGDKALVIFLYPPDADAPADDAAEGAADKKTLPVNGFSACTFTMDGCLYYHYFIEEGYVLAFNFYPASDYVFSAMARIIASSVQPYEAEE